MEPFGRCRVCGSTELTFLFSLGEQYLNNFVEPGKHLEGEKYPIELEMCPRCTLVQLRHTAPQDFLYTRHYWYRSGVTNTMRAALKDVVDDACELACPAPFDVFLDIGSNDGTLLREVPHQMLRIGVEPADNLQAEGKQGINFLIHDFWNAASYRQATVRPAKIITALGMFYDMDDPNQFVHDVAQVLSDDGVFIAQLMCLANMIESKDVGNLCHEHLEFYSFNSLVHLYTTNGLEIIDVQKNMVNGGSYRIYARKKGGTVQPRKGADARVFEVKEREEGFDDADLYRSWFRRIERNRDACVNFIQQEVTAGKRVWVYGASTKGNTILQWYNLDSSVIEGAAERSPEKWGKVTIGTGIPIYSEEEARAANPDYFLVLPYAFLSEFLGREKAWRSQGGKFIVPLPEFKVI